MHLPFISHGCSAEVGAERGMASQGSDTCLVQVAGVGRRGGTAEHEAARGHAHLAGSCAVHSRNVSQCCRMGWAAKGWELSHEWGAGITQKCHWGSLWHSPWAAQVEGGVFSWLRGAACVGAQHGSSGIGSIQGQVGPCPREHLEGGSSQSWQCPVHTESPMAMWDAVGVNGARGAPAGENQAGLWVQQLAGHRGTLGRGGPCRQCSCRWHQIRAVTVAWTWVEAAAVT